MKTRTGSDNHLPADPNAIVATERRRRIYSWAAQYGSVKVNQVSEALGVGENTIRNDLDALQNEGKLVRVHGGAVLKDSAVLRRPYAETRATRMAEKSLIGAAALALVPDSGTVFLGSGSTMYQLVTRFPRSKSLHVVTNSLENALSLAADGVVSVDFLGGSIRADALESDCTLSEEALLDLHWDVAFMGAHAVDVARGITTDDRVTARWEKTVIEHGRQVILLCDSSKLGQYSYAQTGPVSMIDVLVTDSGADAELVRCFEKEGVRVVVAGQGGE